MANEIIDELAEALAKANYKELYNKVNGMTFIEAYNALNGYNLQLNDSKCGNELISLSVSFDVDFNNITLTIFQDENGGCELGECVEVHIDNFMGPIMTLTLSILEC